MTQTEYELKRAECWIEFCKEHPIDTPTMAIGEAFCAAFDRAYALGKEKEDATTQQDYKSSELECWCDFCNTEIARKNSFDRTLVKAANNFAFFRGYRFGKQEKEADTSLWSRLTEDEKREMQCRYHTNECVLRDHKKRTGDKAQSKAVARMKLLENLFGKENLKTHNNG